MRRATKNTIPGASLFPPYHPNYKEQQESDRYSEGSSDGQFPKNSEQLHVRRGSEGYEVRPTEREEMLSRYLKELGEEPGRYVRYIPQVEDESDDDDDDTPLAYRAERFGG